MSPPSLPPVLVLSREMPLLHRKPFVRQNPPEDLDPDEEVFLCKITHEIFRSYDEFFERTILCNSLVWSCALTGRAGLTYLEALESERRARVSLQNFPVCLLTPLLLLVKHNPSKRLSELSEDVYSFTKERYFPGETVDVSVRNGNRLVCQVKQVLPPYSSANGSLADPRSGANGSLAKAEDDSIVISDSDEELTTPPPQINGKRTKPLSASAFRYSVKPLKDDSEPFTVKASQISRMKNVLSREKLKLLFKQHCELHNGAIVLKGSSVSRYSLLEQSFSQFFPDDPPLFSPSSRGSPAQAGLSLLKAAEEKLKLLQQKEEMAVQKTHKKKDKDKHREEKQKEDKHRQEEERQRDRLKEDREKLREELRLKRMEEKEQRRLEKEREREKLKEEKKKYAERLKLLNKRTEDLECDDLKDLPSPVPVRTRLPSDLFGEALMVLEFLRAFGEVFELKDEFPDGLSLETLEEALVGSDPEGPLCELLFFFLSAIFQASDDEQEENQDQDPSEAVDEAADSAPSTLAAMTLTAGAWPQQHQGQSLRKLDLDSCTLTEILRLQILSATQTDDPCLELSRSEPQLIHKLTKTAVYDLTPGEKLRILNTLVGKLLTLGLSRDLIEDCVEEQKAARQELREIRAEQHRRDREEAAHRVRLRKEERLREQELRMKEKEDRLREQENISQNGTGPEPNQYQQNNTKGKDYLKEPQPVSDPKPSAVSLSPEELQKEQEKVGELLERLQRAACCTSLLPLGKDRWFRRYWLLPSASALFVEEDSFGLPRDMIRPQSSSSLAPNGSPRDEDLKEELSRDSSASSHAHQISGPASLASSSAPQWWFFSSKAQLEQLLEALNPRGNRESGLKEALLQELDRITAALQQSPSSRFCLTEEQTFPECTAAETVMEARLRDLLLDIEDRVHQGTLGTLKVTDRQLWRSALETGNYQSLSDCCEEQTMDPDPGPEDSDSLEVLGLRSSVQALASALAQIERGIERRSLKAPLVDEDLKKEQKTKKNKRKDEDQASEDGSDSGRVSKSVLERWRESLQNCSSLSQVFVHLSTLERSILWSRSVLNARCRICRRKGDADNMLLCDSCDRGHHTHCLRPKLKSIPGGDWFCPDCRPKQRSSRVPSRQRSSIDEDSEEEESEEDEESEEESDEEEEEESDDQQESLSSKTPAPPPKGKNQSASSKSQQATPRSQQVTPRPTGSAGKASAFRSSGKKLSPPSSKAPSRGSSSRLSHEIPAPNSSKPQTCPDPGPAPKPSRPVLSSSSSSSSRRSSGRNYGVHELSACEQIVVELVRHQDSWPFMKLVSRTQVPDYYDIIKKPIALSIIREKVNSCKYQSAAEFICDVELMFSNCLQYNPRHSNEAKAGVRLQGFFHSTLVQLGLGSSDGGPAAKRSRY